MSFNQSIFDLKILSNSFWVLKRLSLPSIPQWKEYRFWLRHSPNLCVTYVKVR